MTISKKRNQLSDEAKELLRKKGFLGRDAESLKRSFAEHMEFTQAKTVYTATDLDVHKCFAHTIHDRLMELWNASQKAYYEQDVKRVYYLSMEFLMGRALGNSIINLDIQDEVGKAMKDLGYTLEDLQDGECDAALGNGGLGRLAACFMDSLATLQYPGMGYGIRYDYGMFEQKIKDGWQIEHPDHWLRDGYPWLTIRPEHTFTVNFYGEVNWEKDENGRWAFKWTNTQKINAIAYDLPIPGFKNGVVNNLRLWSAEAAEEFNLDNFNRGDYITALVDKVMLENISRVLYPSDNIEKGKRLRLKQEYFLVSAALQDIVRRHKVKHQNLDNFSDKVAIQLNDTHPVLAIPEMMRILMDQEGYDWEKAWEITTKTFAYTNHTVLPEALECWPVALLGEILPRHMQIIYEINHRFLEGVRARFPQDLARLERMSLIGERGKKHVRMANLAIVGSYSTNGVAKLHSEILKNKIFRDFYEMWPERFNNKTNGITQRRWLKLANPRLSDLITSKISDSWIKNLDDLKKLEVHAKDKKFGKQWNDVKRENKKDLADYIKRTMNIDINVDSMFDCQVKRFHEYKRQLLNVFHVVTYYNRICQGRTQGMVPRTFIFSGKSAPGYGMAKRIIKLINNISNIVNNDPKAHKWMKVVFLENYSVSLAEKIMAASDLSEQISTAGMEASGTGNMKLSLNGSLTIGTLDGANIEIKDEVGNENIFIFGATDEEVVKLRERGHNPWGYYNNNEELKAVVDMIKNGFFSPEEPKLFEQVIDPLFEGDYFMVLADYADYISCQERVSKLYQDKDEWVRKSIINTANCGYFSSDRTIKQYAEEIWQVKPVKRSGSELNFDI